MTKSDEFSNVFEEHNDLKGTTAVGLGGCSTETTLSFANKTFDLFFDSFQNDFSKFFALNAMSFFGILKVIYFFHSLGNISDLHLREAVWKTSGG